MSEQMNRLWKALEKVDRRMSLVEGFKKLAKLQAKRNRIVEQMNKIEGK